MQIDYTITAEAFAKKFAMANWDPKFKRKWKALFDYAIMKYHRGDVYL